LQPAGFYAFNAFPAEVYTTLQKLKSSSTISSVRNTKSGISSTVVGGSMAGAGARLASGGIQGDAYGFYAHHKTSSVSEINKLMDVSLVSIYCQYVILL
jgi:hypothetical protein